MHQHNFPGATNTRHPETNPHFEPSPTEPLQPLLHEGEDHYPLHLGSWGSPPIQQPGYPQSDPRNLPVQPQNLPHQQPTGRQWGPLEREREREPTGRQWGPREREPRKKGKKPTRVPQPPLPLYDQQPPNRDSDPRFAPPLNYEGKNPSDRQPHSGGSASRVTLPPDHHDQHSTDQKPPTFVVPAPTLAPSRPHQGEHPSGVRPIPPPQGTPVPKKQDHELDHKSRRHRPPPLSPEHRHSRHGDHNDLLVPKRQKTNWLTWFAAYFCAIFWVLIILGGLIVLIVYLVFRPRSPRFDVSSATLNAAYLDVGVLLNADLRVLANFTNPNKKVSVDFSYVTLDLHFGNILIATQYVRPFKAARAKSMFADVHMITSQVRLSPLASELLKRQIANNRVHFEVRGIFHARSKLGNFLGYSYKLYSTCNIELTGPPTGVLRSSKCKTKR